MKTLIDAIHTNEWKEVSKAISDIPNLLSTTEYDLLSMIDTLPLIVTNFTDAYSFEFEGEQITRYRYESLIWELGESFRQVLQKKRSLRRNPALFTEIERVSMDNSFGKGRKSFVMLLGQYGGMERVSVLRILLLDNEVCGHAVYALRLLASPEVAEDIRPFLDFPKKWVRDEAKKYFEKISKETQG